MNPAQRRHLIQMHCLPSGASGKRSWTASSDLFGAAHLIEVSWDAEAISGRRLMTEESSTPITAWEFKLVRVADRWRVGSAAGQVFEMDAPSLAPTVFDIVQRVRGEISGLHGMAPARPARARRPGS